MVEGCEQWELDSKETKDREDNIADKRQPLSYIITQDIVIRSVFSNKLTTNQEAVFLVIRHICFTQDLREHGDYFQMP